MAEYTLPGRGRACAFSPNGIYIAVGHWISPCFTLLKWNGISLSKVDDYNLGLDANAVYGCSFSPDGKYIATMGDYTPYFTLLEWDGNDLTKANEYELAGRGADCSFLSPLNPLKFRPPTDLRCEQKTNPTDVTDPQPEFSAVYHYD